MNSTRILILEDEMVIARDLQSILSKIADYQLEIANSSDEFLDKFPTYLPHLVLSDINLEEKDCDGLTLVEKMQRGFHFATIFITAHSSKEYLKSAGALNPKGYILKPFDDEQVVAAVQVALKSEDAMHGGRAKPGFLSTLTEREHELLKLISQGMSSNEIANHFFISPKTVDNHRYNIAKKLSLDSKNNSLQAWALSNRAKI